MQTAVNNDEIRTQLQNGKQSTTARDDDVRAKPLCHFITYDVHTHTHTNAPNRIQEHMRVDVTFCTFALAA